MNKPGNHDRWHLLASRAIDTIWDWDVVTGHVWRSDAIAILGYPPEEAQATHEWWLSLLHPDDRHATMASCRAVLDGGGLSWRGEYRLRRRDATWAHVLDRAIVVRDGEGRAVRMVGMIADRSARAEVEADLRAKHELVDATLASLDEGVWAMNADGKVAYLSPSIERIFGRPFAELRSEGRAAWIRAIHPDDRERVLREEEWNDRSGGSHASYRICWPNGDVRWVSDKHWVVRDASGETERLGGIMADITDGVLAEAQLVAERKALEQILRGAPLHEVLASLCRSVEERGTGAVCAMLLLDRSGARLVEGAPTPLADVAGRALVDFAIDAAFRPASAAATSAQPVYVADIEQDTRVGRWREAALGAGLRSCWAYPILDGEDRVLGTFITYHRRPRQPSAAEIRHLDRMAMVAGMAISRKRMEAQLLTANRLASVGTLAAGVAHEINNPLAFILGNISFLRAHLADLAGTLPRAGLPAPEGRGVPRAAAGVAALQGAAAVLREMDEALADCSVGARRIESIVRDLRAFSRGAEDEHIVPVGLKRVLEFAMRMAFNEVRQRAQLVRDFEFAPTVLADEGRLVQVVVNLLMNAAQAMPDGGGDDNVVTVSARAEGDRAIVEVHDNGVGIAPEVLPRIFDPFFTTRAVGQGTGLGLAISHGLITSMNGTLVAESASGAGSCFRITLPLAPREGLAAPPPEPSAPRESPLVAGYGAGRRLRMLVIDDETLVGASLRRLVGQRYDVVHVEDARAALELLQREPFDVVLCDLMMPALTGMELHAELERVSPELARRTGFITGGTFTDRAREFVTVHRVKCLEKPFSAEAVQSLVERLVA